MQNKKRGQISVEYVMIIGAVLLVTIPLFFYAIYETNKSVRLNQASDAVHTIANAADTVYSLGPGSKKTVWVAIPSGVVSSTVSGNEIFLTLSQYGGHTDIVAISKAVMVGTLTTERGTHKITVETLSSGVVQLKGSNYSESGEPSVLGTYPDPNPGEIICPGFITLSVDTDEAATCKFNETDTDYDSMEYTMDGRGLTHTYTLFVDVNLNKTYYSRCMDSFGNKMTSSVQIDFETGIPCGAEGTGNLTGSGLNLSDDISPPEVHLIYPENGHTRNYSYIDVFYNVTDINSSIDFCLGVAEGIDWMNRTALQFKFDPNPLRNISNNVTFLLEKGTYTWYINCTDNSSNKNKDQSEIWALDITKTITESFLASCAGECGRWGYSDGVCDTSPNACNDDCVPPTPHYTDSNPDVECYAGDAVSAEYCTGGSQADTCCCVM